MAVVLQALAFVDKKKAFESYVNARPNYLVSNVYRYHDTFPVSVLANLGMSTQLAVFGVLLVLGRPLDYVWLLLAEVLVVVMLFARRETLMRSNREVVLEHR